MKYVCTLQEFHLVLMQMLSCSQSSQIASVLFNLLFKQVSTMTHVAALIIFFFLSPSIKWDIIWKVGSLLKRFSWFPITVVYFYMNTLYAMPTWSLILSLQLILIIFQCTVPWNLTVNPEARMITYEGY